MKGSVVENFTNNSGGGTTYLKHSASKVHKLLIEMIVHTLSEMLFYNIKTKNTFFGNAFIAEIYMNDVARLYNIQTKFNF